MTANERLKLLQSAIQALSSATVAALDQPVAKADGFLFEQPSGAVHILDNGSVVFVPFEGLVPSEPMPTYRVELTSWPRDKTARQCEICNRKVG